MVTSRCIAAPRLDAQSNEAARALRELVNWSLRHKQSRRERCGGLVHLALRAAAGVGHRRRQASHRPAPRLRRAKSDEIISGDAVAQQCAASARGGKPTHRLIAA